jgi:hypothetical protein
MCCSPLHTKSMLSYLTIVSYHLIAQKPLMLQWRILACRSTNFCCWSRATEGGQASCEYFRLFDLVSNQSIAVLIAFTSNTVFQVMSPIPFTFTYTTDRQFGMESCPLKTISTVIVLQVAVSRPVGWSQTRRKNIVVKLPVVCRMSEITPCPQFME